MPHRNPLCLLYDSGDYAAAQDRAITLADWAGFETRRAEARRAVAAASGSWGFLGGPGPSVAAYVAVTGARGEAIADRWR
jgi:aerobic carbon-monoxide dehydrogenase large subunit